jgi:cell division protease FtsH
MLNLLFASLAFSPSVYPHIRPRIETLNAAMGYAQETAWSYSELMKGINHHAIRNAVFLPDATIKVVDNANAFHSTQLIPQQVTGIADALVQDGVDVLFQQPSGASVLVRELLGLIPYVVIFYVFMSVVSRLGGGNLMKASIMGSGGIEVVQETNTTFENVAGSTIAKEELQEVVNFLKNPVFFKSVGAKIPKGVLLEGPPGTGKTLLARAVAGEAGTSFISISASSFVEMYVGLGAARVRALFETARKNAPCIVWIDEIDAVGRKRASSGVNSGNEERETTLNELLASMDGFNDSEGVVVLAATNRADILDSALIRPGRFDRRIPIPLPTLYERKDILKVHMRDKKIEDLAILDAVAARTPGFSGADLANLVNEAAIRVVRRNATVMCDSDINDALERITLGIPRNEMKRSSATKSQVAIHEAGHVVCAVMLDYDKISTVSIVPRSSGAGGITSFIPNEDRSVGGLYTLEYLNKQLAVLLGGRAAEEVVLGRNMVSTGASSDLERVYSLARRMVTEWGFGSTISASQNTPVGEEATTSIDRDIESLVSDAYGVALSCINSNLSKINILTQSLLEYETLPGKRVYELLSD